MASEGIGEGWGSQGKGGVGWTWEEASRRWWHSQGEQMHARHNHEIASRRESNWTMLSSVGMARIPKGGLHAGPKPCTDMTLISKYWVGSMWPWKAEKNGKGTKHWGNAMQKSYIGNPEISTGLGEGQTKFQVHPTKSLSQIWI